jgi:hypothetical protein
VETLDERGCCTASSGDNGWNLEVDGWQNNVSDTEGNVFLSSITITSCTGRSTCLGSFSDKSIAGKGLDGGDSLDGDYLDGDSLQMEGSSKELLENDSLSST